MAFNAFVGWSLSSLALYFLNKNSNSTSDSSFEPDSLNVNSNQTKIGSPIPVILGRCLLKSPLVVYFGDFRADRYTETYAAHGNFNAGPLVFALILQYIVTAITGHQVTPGTVATTGTGYHGVPVHSTGISVGATYKDDLTGPLLNALFMWLLGWLINGRNLKTTIQKGFKYYLGYQFILCWSGENMRIRKIYMQETSVWEGDEWRNAQTNGFLDVRVDNPELFGGVDEQGGFIGNLHVYLGGESQPVDSWMVTQMSAESVQENLRGLTPAYRPFVSIVVPTAYIGKSATIPETWIELQNCPNKLGLGAIGEDANPAEVLYELHINTSWGLAENSDLINIESMKKIGETLKKEGLGISAKLYSKSQASELIDNICDHINAVKYTDIRTGKLTYRLIRDDYDVNTLPRLDTSILSNIELSRPCWLDTVSDISVVYTDRKAQYEQSTIPAIDPANIEINGGTRTTKTYSFTYFTTSQNALWAAKREQFQQGYPLATVSMEGNRHLSSLRIGDVVLLDWNPYGIKNMLLRINNIEHADFIDGSIRIDAMEDVFGLTKVDFGFSGSTEWIPKETYPTGVQVFRYLEMPWELSMEQNTFVSAFAIRPDDITQIWTVWRRRTGKEFESTSSMSNWTAGGRLVYDYEEFTDAEDLVGFEIAEYGGIADLESNVDTDIAHTRTGGKLLIIDDEIMAYSTLQLMANGHWYVKGVLRGIFDTVPKKHVAQSTVFFIRSGFYSNVTTGGHVCSAGTIVTEDYNITTATVDHSEAFDVLKSKQLKTTRRPELPSVPGRVRVEAHAQQESIHLENLTGNFKLSWIPRDKKNQLGCVSQDDEIEYWTKRKFKQPADTCCLIRISIGSESKDYLTQNEDTTFIYSWEQRCIDFPNNFIDPINVKLYTKDGDLLSYQAQERQFKWGIPMLVDFVNIELEGKSKITDWSISDRITVPKGPVADERQVLFSELPLLIIGEKTDVKTSETLVAQDGSYWNASPQYLAVISKDTYEVRIMEAGFIFSTFFVSTASGGLTYYQWDGKQFNLLDIKV